MLQQMLDIKSAQVVNYLSTMPVMTNLPELQR